MSCASRDGQHLITEGRGRVPAVPEVLMGNVAPGSGGGGAICCHWDGEQVQEDDEDVSFLAEGRCILYCKVGKLLHVPAGKQES